MDRQLLQLHSLIIQRFSSQRSQLNRHKNRQHRYSNGVLGWRDPMQVVIHPSTTSYHSRLSRWWCNPDCCLQIEKCACVRAFMMTYKLLAVTVNSIVSPGNNKIIIIVPVQFNNRRRVSSSFLSL